MANNNEEESFHRQKLRAEIKNISDSLSIMRPDNTPKLAEHIFVGVFLPLFAGDEKLQYAADFQMWVNNVAGGEFKEVDIVDTAGKVLFTVPALFDRTTINSITGDGPSIAHVIVTAGQYSRIHPRQGAMYLAKELDARATILKLPANMLKHLDIWNSIFKRYNRPEIMEHKSDADIAVTGDTGKYTEEDFELL